MTDAIYKTILNVLTAEGRPAPGLAVTRQTPLGDGGFELTSLELVRVLVRLEELLGVELDDAVLGTVTIRTVGELADVLTDVSAVGGELAGRAS